MIIFFLILSTLIDQICDKSSYKPYVRLVTGFMLITLMLQPVTAYLGQEDIVTQAISSAANKEIETSFLDDAKEEKQRQIKEQITKIFKQYKEQIQDVTVELNDQGNINQLTIQGKKIKHKKKLKTIISNFYNMKESNINISE